MDCRDSQAEGDCVTGRVQLRTLAARGECYPQQRQPQPAEVAAVLLLLVMLTSVCCHGRQHNKVSARAVAATARSTGGDTRKHPKVPNTAGQQLVPFYTKWLKTSPLFACFAISFESVQFSVDLDPAQPQFNENTLYRKYWEF